MLKGQISETISNENSVDFFASQSDNNDRNLDPNCFYKFSETLVRIEYPGNVKNCEKAIETLGGIEEIQKAVDGNKLELSFHPKSQYIKGCIGDVDRSLGILIKAQKLLNGDISYDVIGVSDMNFKFNRMCDFQYLPLVTTDKPETEQSKVDYVHNKIILDKIPTLDWFIKKTPNETPLFLTSVSYARFDQPQIRFESNSYETFHSMVRNDAPQLSDLSKKKMKAKVCISSIRLPLHKNINIPKEPPQRALENVKSKFLQQQLKNVRPLFDERPIWTKAAILHKANVNQDSAKQILPCIAYYCYSGPWRTCWIRLGYNPVNDYNSRIYQILDFRIRATEGMQMKVKAKRTTSNNLSKSFTSKKVTDAHYIIRPNQIPPARQMFYQYCDILFPEVQEMLSKLPKLPSTAKFDSKNGWLPLSFQEHCREIVNRYTFEAVQQEMLKEQEIMDMPQNITTAYCSQMLNNIKKGFSQSVGEYSGVTLRQDPNDIEQIDLSYEEDNEEIDMDRLMKRLPERLPETFEDDDDDDREDSDLEIDLEAVEEVNEIVGAMKDHKL
ncbi:hypothetical protein ABEB36_002063 [Hypothenemus hampei]|uniref:General transcription factor 3C polypeptide 5 n=1 Tax=Hypothenemus hampei TaxID=57062 RepID=A0ABD1F4H2_HYPHA